VLALGVFDVLHPGHIAHLRAARALGDHLTVGLTKDEYVNKGPGHPLFPYVERARMLACLREVDEVVSVPLGSPSALIEHLKPTIYCKGIEYRDAGMCPEHETVIQNGGVVKYLKTPPVYSSTKIMTGEMLRERIESLSTSC